MGLAEDEIAAAGTAIGLAETTFIDFDAFSPEPVPLQDYIAWVKEQLANESEEPIGSASDAVTIIDTSISDQLADPINQADGDAIDALDGINNTVDQADQAAADEVDSIFKDMEGATFTSTFPVLDLLSGVQSGAIEFADLPAAVADSIQSNILFALEFLTNNNVADVSRKTSAVLDAIVESGKGVINTVADSAQSIVDGIVAAIDAALDLVAAIILDPIALLLQAILEAIRGIPGLIVGELLGQLLKQAPAGTEI